MPTILVVEEAVPIPYRIGNVLATRKDFVVAMVQPAEALEEISARKPDLVVIDLRISHRDSLDLVSSLREDFPYVPIILMTTGSNNQTAIESLRRGASSYVPRKTIDSELIPTIQSLLNLVGASRSRSGVSEILQSSSYSFCLTNDYQLVSAVVSYLEQSISDLGACDGAESVRVSVALLEALSNALYHGNLELESPLREKNFDAYHAAALERSQQAPYRDRRIFVDSTICREKIEFVIRDEGKGFDPEQLPDTPQGPNLDKVSGRGIMLMQTMMDEVIFSESGNQVTMVKHFTRHPAKARSPS